MEILRNNNLFGIYRYILKTTVIIFIIFSGSSCEKLVEVGPPNNELVTPTIYTSDQLASSAISGLYYEMTNSTAFIGGDVYSIQMLGGLSADELISFEEFLMPYETNGLIATGSDINDYIWNPIYKYIYYANSILEGLERSSAVSEATKKQIEGEAKFIRALSYFYLTNLFGDVPLVLTTDYRVNSVKSRSAQHDVYNQIIEDLSHAKLLLASDYSLFNNGRVRATKWAASALLARVYLYQKDWPNAESESSLLIDHTPLFSFVNNIADVFLKDSPEAIWQLMPANDLENTKEARVFIAYSTPNYVSLTESLVDAFEPADKRKTDWVNNIDVEGTVYYFPFKYKLGDGAPTVNEYSIILRLSEQYLIRAEARAQQNKTAEAIADIDIIRQRAGLPLIADTDPSITQENLLQKIKHERQVELFSEGGHRWLDLKRWDDANTVLSQVKGANWQSTDVLYPIPQRERESDPNLTQNDGY